MPTSPQGESASSDAQMPPMDRALYRILLTRFLATGEVPAGDVLTKSSGLSPDAVTERVAALAAGDYLAFDHAGRLTCLYPFSAVPTPHVVVVERNRRYAMCSIDALGIAAMLGQEVEIEGACARCGRALRLRVRPGEVVPHDPAGTVVVARRDDVGPSAGSCCPFTLFACSDIHGQELMDRTPGSVLLSLPDALQEAERIFGDLLRAEALPRSRRHIESSER